MPTYDVTKDFGDTDISVSPSWVLAVVRFKNVVTFSRVLNESNKDAISQDQVADVRGKTLIIASDCLQLNISYTKGSFISNLGATLQTGDIDYLSEIMPGDWVFAWIVYGQDKAQTLVTRIENGEACNKFDDGLKFMGRVNSIRKTISIERGTGTKDSKINLQANGFTEFNSYIYYDARIGEKDIGIATYLGKLAGNINPLIAPDQDWTRSGYFDTNSIIPFLMEIFFGKGIQRNFLVPEANSTDAPSEDQLSIGAGGGIAGTGGTYEAPFAYIIPRTVGDLLGKARNISKTSKMQAYVDILETVCGVQKYNSPGSANPGKLFEPVGAKAGNTYQQLDIPVLGKFLPVQESFTNKPIWTILNSFLNPAVNEIFTSLRVNGNGDIVPTLTIRQIPFTSPLYPDDPNKVTFFHELPRWKISDTLVFDADVGRSDAMRHNFVHVFGQPYTLQKTFYPAQQIAKNRPIQDAFDIQTQGLRTDMQTVACADIDANEGGPKDWMKLRADILMGAHLTLSGTINTIGIEAPICIGDNIEWDGVLYHIEGITHTAAIMGGVPTFISSFSVSHGMNATLKANQGEQTVQITKDSEMPELFAVTSNDSSFNSVTGSYSNPNLTDKDLYVGLSNAEHVLPSVGNTYEAQDSASKRLKDE